MSRKISKHESKFNAERFDASKKAMMLELLYAQQLQINKLNHIRSNVSIITWIVVIYTIISLIAVFSIVNKMSNAGI